MWYLCSRSPSLVDGVFQVLGPFRSADDRNKLFPRKYAVAKPDGCHERTNLFFLRTALKIHRILQMSLYGCNEGAFIHGHGIGTVPVPSVAEDTFQIIRNQISEIFVLANLYNFQRL